MILIIHLTYNEFCGGYLLEFLLYFFSIFLEDCHPGEVDEIIKSYSNSKSSDISIYVLKSVSHIISPLLSRYYNNFMRRGEFPDITKPQGGSSNTYI